MRHRALMLIATASLFACSGPEFRPRAVGSLNAGVLAPNELMAEARLHFASGNFALAVNSYRRVLRQSPGDVEAYRGLASAYEALGRRDLASRYYQEALARAPADQAALQDYAGLQDRIDDPVVGEREPLPVQIAQSVPPSAQPAGAVPRLERLSTGEVALITHRDSALARASDAPRALPGRALPIRLVSSGSELVFELGSEPRQVAQRTAPLRILNAVGRQGQAGRMSGFLRSLGWASLSVGDSPARRSSSIVVAPPAMREEAQALVRALPFPASLRIATRGSQILLVLGRDAIDFDRSLARNTARA